jgi:hypothetical protein
MNNVVRRTMLLVTFIFVGSLAIPAAAQTTATRRPLRIYVFTQVAEPGEPIPPDQKARQDAVADLKASLVAHRKVLAKAISTEQADLSLEVVKRELRDTEDVVTISPKFGGDSLSPAPSATPTRKAFVSVRLKVVGRDTTANIEGAGPGWTYAADDVWKSVERWVNTNQSRLEQQGPQK